MLAEAFLSIGIPLTYLLAGTWGGVVNAVIFKRSGPNAIMGAVIVGAATGAYLTDFMVILTSTYIVAVVKVPAGIAFIVGFSGGAICKILERAIIKVLPASLKLDDKTGETK